MQALRITAALAAGFVASDPWSPAIDGIIAYWLLRERLGEEVFTLNASDDSRLAPVEGLPLAVERHGAWWWYCCSAPLCDVVARHRRHYHRRFDRDAAETRTAAGRLLTTAGPYKDSRLSEVVTLTGAVTWHAIGDGGAVERLLRRCTVLGRGGARGHGQVTGWTVTPDGDARLARHHRPLPADYADAAGIDGPRMLWGIRPPGRLLANRALCVMPTAPAPVAAQVPLA